MRARPPILRALGRSEPPSSIVVDDWLYRLCEIYKHDSWAATARYQSHGDGLGHEIVCKFNRAQPILFLPTRWLGNWLANRERTAYQALEKVDGVTQGCGRVCTSEGELRNAVAHHFIAGHPLRSNEKVSDTFFPELMTLLLSVHQAGFAYVDLHKRENILVGEDGSPNLIDFQISYRNPPVLGSLSPFRWLLGMFQSSDLFCLYKHVRHFRPDQIGLLGLQRFQNIPWWIRLHRLVAVPFRQTRRRLLSWLAIRDRSGSASSELFTEHALRE